MKHFHRRKYYKNFFKKSFDCYDQLVLYFHLPDLNVTFESCDFFRNARPGDGKRDPFFVLMFVRFVSILRAIFSLFLDDFAGFNAPLDTTKNIQF